MALFTLKTQALSSTPIPTSWAAGGRTVAIALAKPLIATRSSHQAGGRNHLHSNFQKLLAERIDFVVTGLYTGRALLLREGLADPHRPLPRLVNEGFIHHGFCGAPA